MRKVSYFSAGLVADFAISDQAFDKFLGYLADAEGEIDAYGENDLSTARTILDNFMAAAQQDEDIDQGPGEVLAACFIWNFFNTHPDGARMIEGDIVVVDYDGMFGMVEYASAKDVKLDTGHDHDHGPSGRGCG